MPRPRKKANRIEAEATRTGQLKAEQKFRLKFLDARFSWKNRAISLVDYLRDSIANVNPLELVAIGGIAYLVYQNIPSWIAEIVGMEETDVKNVTARILASYVTGYIVVKHAGALIGLAGELTSGIFDIFKMLIVGKAIGGLATTSSVAGVAGKFSSAAFWAAAGPIPLPLVTLIPQLSPEQMGIGTGGPKVAIGANR